MKCGWLEADSKHKIWLGRARVPLFPEGPWRDVVREYPVPFGVWLSRLGSRQGGAVGKIAEVFEELSYGWQILGPPDTEGVFQLADSDPQLKGMVDVLSDLKEHWNEFTNPLTNATLVPFRRSSPDTLKIDPRG